MLSTRSKVLSLYRQILRISRTREAENAEDTLRERLYIHTEARRIFHENKNVSKSSEQTIQ